MDFFPRRPMPPTPWILLQDKTVKLAFISIIKMTSYRMMMDPKYGRYMMTAVSGPTHDDQPPFSWLTADFADDTPHEGHPDVWQFDPITTNW